MQRMWVLKKQPYRETSVLVTVLSEDDITYRGVARGGRGRCAEFQPLCATLKAPATGLARLSNIEQAAARVPLDGTRLIAALYANEIMTLMIPEGAELPGIFDEYTQILAALARGDYIVLRRLERLLLNSVGGYPQLAVDQYGEAIDPEAWYRLHQNQSLVAVEAHAADALLGDQWLAIANASFVPGSKVAFATWLHRSLIDAALGGKRLITRELMK
jgi:Recombinational DNA repair protein (RecF pathway)